MPHHHHEDKHNHKPHEHKGKTSRNFIDTKEVLSHLDISEGQTIMDAGCGDGYMAQEFAALVKSTGRVYAMDADDEAIANLKKASETNTLEPVVGDITEKTNLAESSIDLIYISNVMHGFSESQTAGFVKEVQRLLKSGGTLAVLEFKKEETPHGPPLEIRISPQELRKMVPLKPKRMADIGKSSYLQLFEK